MARRPRMKAQRMPTFLTVPDTHINSVYKNSCSRDSPPFVPRRKVVRCLEEIVAENQAAPRDRPSNRACHKLWRGILISWTRRNEIRAGKVSSRKFVDQKSLVCVARRRCEPELQVDRYRIWSNLLEWVQPDAVDGRSQLVSAGRV